MENRILGTVAAIALLGSTPAMAQAFDEYAGVETFMRFCASCHGESGHGDGPVSEAIPIAVPDLTKLRHRYDDDFPAALLRKIVDGREPVIYHGTRYMPVWGYEFWVEEGADADAEQRVETIVSNLVDYIESIQE